MLLGSVLLLMVVPPLYMTLLGRDSTGEVTT